MAMRWATDEGLPFFGAALPAAFAVVFGAVFAEGLAMAALVVDAFAVLAERAADATGEEA